MRYVYALATILALSSCIPAEPQPFVSGESSLGAADVVVPPGPVMIPALPSAHSALTANQILCDSYRVTASGADDGDDAPRLARDDLVHG